MSTEIGVIPGHPDGPRGSLYLTRFCGTAQYGPDRTRVQLTMSRDEHMVIDRAGAAQLIKLLRSAFSERLTTATEV